MKRMVVLRPVKGGKKIWFTGTIVSTSGGRTVVTSDWNIKTVEQLKVGERALSAHFDHNYTALIIEWDSIYEDGPKKDEYGSIHGEIDYKKFKAATELCKHHQIKPLYGIKNPNLKGIPLFELEDLAVRNQYGSSRIVNQFKVVSKLLTMDYVQLTDCAYYYGYSGTSKNRSDLFIYLGDFKLGVLHDDVIRGNNNISVMDDFLERYTITDKSVLKKIVLEKALTKGLINKLDNGYFYNNAYIGTQKEHILDYLNGNQPIFDHISKQVNMMTLGEDDIEGILKTADNHEKRALPESEALIKENKSEELLLRSKAKEMHIRSWKLLGVDKLKEEIARAEGILNKSTEYKINIDNPYLYINEIIFEIEKYERRNKLNNLNKPVEVI